MITSTKNCLDKLNETKPEYLKIEREKSGSWELDVSNKRVPTIWYIFFTHFYPYFSLCKMSPFTVQLTFGIKRNDFFPSVHKVDYYYFF